MSEIHLEQPGFNYSACGPFTKNKKKIKTLKETGDSRHIHQHELIEDSRYIYQDKLDHA